MSIKLIHFRDDNQGVSFFEGCSFDINTRAKEVLFNPPSESSFSAGFHEIFIKQKNIICIFDSETKTCRLAAIYSELSECDGDFDFIKRKVNPQIEENHAKNLYKNNFILSLIGMLIDEPNRFVLGLKNVIVEMLGLSLSAPVVAATEPVNIITVAAKSTNANNIEALPATETASPSPSPIIDLPHLSSANNSPTSSGLSSRQKPMDATPIGIPRRNGQDSGSSRSRSIVNSNSPLPAVNQSPAYGPSLISNNNIDNAAYIVSNFCSTQTQRKANYYAFKQSQTPIQAPAKKASRSRTTVNNNNINKALATQRKRMRSNDFGWGENIDFGSNDLESPVAENAPKKRKTCIPPNAAASQSNDKIIHLPNYFFKNVLIQNGKKTSKHLFTMAPNSNSLAYEYESRSESKGEYRCIKCFKNDKKTVSAKYNPQLEQCTLGRNNHQCDPQICERESTDTSS